VDDLPADADAQRAAVGREGIHQLLYPLEVLVGELTRRDAQAAPCSIFHLPAPQAVAQQARRHREQPRPRGPSFRVEAVAPL
jgi:hypothetical protein